MPPAVQITVTGDKAVVQRLNAMPEEVRKALYKKVSKLALDLQTHVRTSKLSGQVLNHRTGRLWRSVFFTVTQGKDEVIGKVATSADVPYARIHEFGGKTRPHDIVARKADALAFMVGGKMIFRRKVRHPGSTMPERSYLRSSLGEFKDKIGKGIQDAIREGMAEAQKKGSRK